MSWAEWWTLDIVDTWRMTAQRDDVEWTLGNEQTEKETSKRCKSEVSRRYERVIDIWVWTLIAEWMEYLPLNNSLHWMTHLATHERVQFFSIHLRRSRLNLIKYLWFYAIEEADGCKHTKWPAALFAHRPQSNGVYCQSFAAHKRPLNEVQAKIRFNFFSLAPRWPGAQSLLFGAFSVLSCIKWMAFE